MASKRLTEKYTHAAEVGRDFGMALTVAPAFAKTDSKFYWFQLCLLATLPLILTVSRCVQWPAGLPLTGRLLSFG